MTTVIKEDSRTNKHIIFLPLE